MMSAENSIEQKSTKDEKARVCKKQDTSLTIRLTLTLREPDEESCSVFNYNSLIAEEKRKRRLVREENQLNGSLEEPDEDGCDLHAKRVAQHFEEKYGGVSAKKKRKKRAPKFYNYTDLASGYDESDSFIDNSEAFDEALPDDMETAFGGYYVNTGQLELKKVEISEENSDLDEIRVGKRKNCVLKSDDDSTSEDDDIAKSDEDDSKTDEENVEAATKKLPEEMNHEEATPAEVAKSVIEQTKSVLLKEKVDHAVKINGNLVVKKKKKYKKVRVEDADQDEAPRHKKKAVTVKSMLEEKRIVENGDGAANGSAKPTENTFSSINDVIESVINAARNRSEDSRDSTSSSSDTKSIDSRTSYETEKESHTDEVANIESANLISNVSETSGSEQVKLPENLSPEVLELVSQIKKLVNSSESGGARSFFKSSVDSKPPSVNSKLLKLESQVRSMKSASRHALYEYLAHFLPCSKDTLMKRAKKLLIEEEERHVVEPLQKLKASIDKMMPALLDNYTVACQKVAEEQNVNDLKNGEIDEKKSIASKMPPMKFIWTDETRGYLRESVSCRLKCFHTLKPRKESAEEYVKKFLELKVKPLWPVGWMETSILMKEANYSNLMPKVKKLSSANSANGSVTGAGGSVSTAAAIITTTTTTTTTTATTTVTSTSTKKSSQSSVPTSTNHVNSMSIGQKTVNHNIHPLALQPLALKYPTQTDVSYSAAPSTGIPYRPDLSMMPPLPPLEMMAHIAMISSQLNPRPSSRSTTPVSSVASASPSYPDKKKSADTSSSKSNEMFKIDSIINSGSKAKKEHHMLNHISQYNKHYSHKTEKRKTHSKKDDNVPSKSVVNQSKNGGSGCNGGTNNNSNKSTSPGVVGATNVTTESHRKSGGRDQVLDLSPNKVKENECDKSDHQPVASIPNNTVTAKDHNYWAKEETKEEVTQDYQSQPRLSFSSPESASSTNTSKTTHLSRKQRLLQESAKSLAQASPYPFTSSSLTKSSESSTKRNESHSISNLVSAKIEEELSNSCDKKRDRLKETATATDLLSMIINDTLQNDPHPLPQFTSNFEKKKMEPEIKTEVDRVISPADFVLRPSSRDSLSSVGSLNAERKTPNSETADIIQDLVTLNQIGGHSIPRRMDYQDSKKYSDFGNGSMMSQSSLHLSDKNKSSSLPIMIISPFQKEFFKHISRSNDGSPS